MLIKLVRHGQSLANVGEVKPHEIGDAHIPLTDLGIRQARSAGIKVGAEFIRDAQRYCSPYLRTRQTIQEMFAGAGVAENPKIYEDPRLREVERGYIEEAPQHELRKIYGWFYYRHVYGESPADCFDRISGFMDSLMRQIERTQNGNVLIVSHGMTIRCFVMRFFHLTVEEFESLGDPHNCDVITIAHPSLLQEPMFISSSGKYGVQGIRLRDRDDIAKGAIAPEDFMVGVENLPVQDRLT